MTLINTTDGPKRVDLAPKHHVNTSAIVEEDLVYEDEEPAIISVLPARGGPRPSGRRSFP